MNPIMERLKRIEAALSMVLPKQVETKWLNRVAGQAYRETPLEQAEIFLEPGRALIGRGGKRWRPLVSILVCEALGGGHRADILAPLTELPHNGSLIVDDIEDSSPIRRGKPAIHCEFGVDLALNMGNFMYFLPTIIFERNDFSPQILAEIVRDWLTVMRRLHLGQGFDIVWHRDRNLFPTRSAYLNMCRFKTGSLSSLAARLGARAASGSASVSPMRVDLLGQTWEDLGTGFQILDDVQNLSTGVPGKEHGDDIVEGKKSLPVVIHAGENPTDKPRLSELFCLAASGEKNAVSDAIALLEKSGAIDKARQEGQTLLGNGRNQLYSLLPDCQERALLVELIEDFVSRMV